MGDRIKDRTQDRDVIALARGITKLARQAEADAIETAATSVTRSTMERLAEVLESIRDKGNLPVDVAAGLDFTEIRLRRLLRSKR